MIWALLALLGVPIWLVVGALAGALTSRRRFRSRPDVFALLFRPHGAKWPRSLSYGRYIGGVLVVNSGIALIRTAIHMVVGAEPVDTDELRGKLNDPVAWALKLEDGDLVDIAVDAANAQHLTGTSASIPEQATAPLRHLPVPETHR